MGNVLQLNLEQIFIQLTEFAKQYGGIYKIRLFNKPVVVVNDPSSIKEVLITQYGDFAGRIRTFRTKLASGNYGGIIFSDTGPEHKGRRKPAHKYLKQYGSGIQKIEDITQKATDDLIQRFADQHGDPIDPQDLLCNCTTDVIAILLIGETISPSKVKEIKQVIDEGIEAFGPGMGMILDWFHSFVLVELRLINKCRRL